MIIREFQQRCFEMFGLTKGEMKGNIELSADEPLAIINGEEKEKTHACDYL